MELTENCTICALFWCIYTDFSLFVQKILLGLKTEEI